MAYSFSRVTSLIGATTSINGIITQIETAVNNLVSKSAINSNQMSTNLDMNSNRLYNLPAPSTNYEPVRMLEVLSVQSGALTLLGPQNAIRGGLFLSTRPDSNNFVTGINSNGDVQYARPSISNISGAFPFATGSAGTGANATATGFSSTNQALFLSGTLTGTGTAPYSLFSITDTASTPGQFLAAHWIAHNIGASAGEGSRVTSQPILTINNPLTDVSNRGMFYIASFPQTYVNANLGGSSGANNARGSVYGGGSLVQLGSGATFLNDVTGHETNVSVQTGASVRNKMIQTVIAVNSDAVGGTAFSAMTAYLIDGSCTYKWPLGISFGSPLGLWPFDTSSTIIGSTTPSSGSRVANIGVDLRNISFTTYSYASTGFNVNNVGDISGQNITGTGTTINGVAASQAIATGAPVTVTDNYSIDSGATKDTNIICNGSASITLTLPNAATYNGRWIRVKTTAAFTVVSASSNVIPLAGGAAGTAILAATAGKYALLISNGTNWVILEAN